MDVCFGRQRVPTETRKTALRGGRKKIKPGSVGAKLPAITKNMEKFRARNLESVPKITPSEGHSDRNWGLWGTNTKEDGAYNDVAMYGTLGVTTWKMGAPLIVSNRAGPMNNFHLTKPEHLWKSRLQFKFFSDFQKTRKARARCPV